MEKFKEIETINNEEKFANESANHFLGEERRYLSEQLISDIIKKALDKSKDEDTGQTIGYNKYKKSFNLDNETNLSAGQIVSAMNWGLDVREPSEAKSLEEKKLGKLIFEKKVNKTLFQLLNKELSNVLSNIEAKKDALKSIAYNKIAQRDESTVEQMGIFSENILTGVIERFSIDRPDLEIKIYPSNAYQDVENKIDFIITAKERKRGIGVNRQDKSIGIQLTTNQSKRETKIEQILKSKEKGNIDVDDIIYIEINNELMKEAIQQWRKSEKKTSGPWDYLPKIVRETTISSIFSGILDNKQIQSLL